MKKAAAIICAIIIFAFYLSVSNCSALLKKAACRKEPRDGAVAAEARQLMRRKAKNNEGGIETLPCAQRSAPQIQAAKSNTSRKRGVESINTKTRKHLHAGQQPPHARNPPTTCYFVIDEKVVELTDKGHEVLSNA